MKPNEGLASLIESNLEGLRDKWLGLVKEKIPVLLELFLVQDLENTTKTLLNQLLAGCKESSESMEGPAFQVLRNSLVDFSQDLSSKNLTPSETAQFIFLLKDVLILLSTERLSKNPEKLTQLILYINRIVDQQALITIDSYLNSKERVIREQAAIILEMSTPVVKVWKRIILLPLVGVLDSSRAKQMMESLLGSIEAYQAKVAIIDISGIPVIDTLVARHLFTTIAAVKLMGSECIVTGISAKISQTIVHLGLDLSGILTRASLEDGLQLALTKTEQKING